jgi:hypothetical protein
MHARLHIFKGKPYGWSFIRYCATSGCAYAHPTLPMESRRGSGDVWWRHLRWKGPTRANIVQLPVAHSRTSPKGTPFGVTWPSVTTSLQVKRPHWGGYCSTSGCACAHPSKGTDSGSRDLWSLPVAMVLVLLYYILYCYSKKTNAGNGCACAEHTSVTSGSGPLPVTWLPVVHRSSWNTTWTVPIYY